MLSPELSRRSGDRALVNARVPGSFATGNNDRSGVVMVPESPACIHDMPEASSVGAEAPPRASPPRLSGCRRPLGSMLYQFHRNAN